MGNAGRSKRAEDSAESKGQQQRGREPNSLSNSFHFILIVGPSHSQNLAVREFCFVSRGKCGGFLVKFLAATFLEIEGRKSAKSFSKLKISLRFCLCPWEISPELRSRGSWTMIIVQLVGASFACPDRCRDREVWSGRGDRPSKPQREQWSGGGGWSASVGFISTSETWTGKSGQGSETFWYGLLQVP